MRSNDNWNEDDDLDFESVAEDTNGIKDLRKAKRADEKRIKELMERLEKFERQERESTIAKVLESKGVNSKAARLILKDLDEVTEQSVNDWLSDNGDLIGYQPEVEQPESRQNVREFSRQDGITQSAQTADASDDLIDMLQNYSGSSEDELMSIINQIAGNPAD